MNRRRTRERERERGGSRTRHEKNRVIVGQETYNYKSKSFEVNNKTESKMTAHRRCYEDLYVNRLLNPQVRNGN